MPELFKVIILGIVEGITEFLPISSTGHLIVVADLLNFEGSIGGTFELFIQFGAVMAVVVFYARDLLAQVRAVPRDRSVRRFWLNIVIAVIPAAIVGFLIREWVKEVLFAPFWVALALLVGGIILILVERRDHAGGTERLFDITPRQAAAVGVAQVIALFPGMSRSGASIVGGLLSGMDRTTATVFSFYLAIPTLGGATVLDLLLSLDEVTADDVVNLVVGALVSFLVALLAIGWLLRYVAAHNFKPFGVYRIIAGLVILAWSIWLA